MVKLIIWDLDGVLWENALSEVGSTGAINYQAIEFIKDTERKGIIHSVCSKNIKDIAQQKLQELGIWDLFVFPIIEYSSKGSAVKEIIQSCQLREENVLFVDDNPINLSEVLFYNSSIHTACNTEFISSFSFEASKSRTGHYKILERKRKDRDNIDFLRDSNINISFCKSLGVLFFDRIKELVNRANQLNFTKSRIHDVSESLMPFEPIDNRNNYIVFAWDKYGYYGLIGYFATGREDHTTIEKFVFSCRILNMGIENYCAHWLRQQGFNLPESVLAIANNVDFITHNKFEDVSDFIMQNENLPPISDTPSAIIVAGCISESLTYLSSLHSELIPGFTRHYNNFLDTHTVNLEDIPNIIIVSVFNELIYFDLTIEQIIDSFNRGIALLAQHNKKVIILLPHNINIGAVPKDQHPMVMALYNFWCATSFDKIYIDITHGNDFRHFTRQELSYISAKIADAVTKNKLTKSLN